MAFEEWLALGGNEIINNARTVGYARTASCPMTWFKGDICGTLAAATLALETWDSTNYERAPWYDKALPDVSRRFYGAFGLSFKGIEDSTRTAGVTEGLGDGGMIGRVRKGPREVQVTAILAGEGQDALEYGMSWLTAALDPNACGQHGDACGTADLTYFSTCPPVRDVVPVYSDWAAQVTNLATNPSMETSFEGAPGTGPSTIGATFTMPTGSAGMLRIVDRGGAVEFWINCTDPFTFTDSLFWSGQVGGMPVSGNVPLPQGFGQRILGSFPISAEPGSPPVNCVLSIPQTNTQGLGGPTTLMATLTRSTEPIPAEITIRTNQANNPSFEKLTGSKIEVRRNMVANPSFEVDATNWAGAGTNPGTLTRTTAQKYKGTASLQVVCDGAQANQGAYTNPGITPAVANQAYTGSVYVKGDAGKTMRLELGAKQGNTVLGSRVSGDPVTLTGGWDRLTVTYPATPANTDGLDLVIRNSAAVAATFYADAALVEAGSDVGDYFDGASPAAGDWTYSWIGAVNASASAQSGALVSDMATNSTAYVVSSTEWREDRDRSILVKPRVGASRDTYASPGGDNGALRLGMLPGKTYTARARVRIKEAHATLTPDSRARTIWVHHGPGSLTQIGSEAAPNVPGVYDLSVTFTLGATDTIAFVRLYNGSELPSDEVWWDEFMLVEGEYDGPYFDGSTTGELRRNHFFDPRGTDLSNVNWGSTGGSTNALSTITDFPGDITTAVRSTRLSTANARIVDFKIGTEMKASTAYRFVARVRSSVQMSNIAVHARPDVKLSGVTSIWATLTIPAGESIIDIIGTTTPGVPSGDAGIVLVGATGGVGATLDVTGVMILEAPDDGAYFDGDHPIAPYLAAWVGNANHSESYLYDPDFTYAWTGDPDASPSVQQARGVADLSFQNNLSAVQSTLWAEDREHSLRLIPTTASNDSNVLVYGSDVALSGFVPGETYTVLATAHLEAPQTGALGGPARGIQAVWSSSAGWGTTFSAEAVAPNEAGDFPLHLTFTLPDNAVWAIVRLFNGASAGGGDVWWDALTIVRGDYAEGYFDGFTESTDEVTSRYVWTGEADASTSENQTRQIVNYDPVPISEYMGEVGKVRRFLHDVAAVSGPIITEEYRSGPHWAYEVEFTLTAGNPYVYGATRKIELSPRFPVTVQDIPYNLAPYPSAELSSGEVIIATNYSTNPSVEVNQDSWFAGSNNAGAQPLQERTNELASTGGYSFKATLTPPASGSAGDLHISNTVYHAFSEAQRVSFNLWASGSVQSGTAVLGDIEFRAQWFGSGDQGLRTDVLGTLPFGGGAVSAKSLTPPPGTEGVHVGAYLALTSWSAGAVIRLYADSLAVTIP